MDNFLVFFNTTPVDANFPFFHFQSNFWIKNTISLMQNYHKSNLAWINLMLKGLTEDENENTS